MELKKVEVFHLVLVYLMILMLMTGGLLSFEQGYTLEGTLFVCFAGLGYIIAEITL